MNKDIQVQIVGVSKKFRVNYEKSLKESILSRFKRMNSKSSFMALNSIDLTISKGETVALLGHNGSGKSTLLKSIGGIIAPTQGKIEVRGRIAALLELGAGFHPDLTGKENVYLNAAILGLTRQETEKVFNQIVEFSGIGDFVNSQVKFYSSGMYIRLAFAVAVHSDPDVLLVDEVLAVGDEPFQRKCLERIRQFQEQGKTILFVSHSAEQVRDICTRAVVLDKGSLVFDGEVNEGIKKLRETFQNRNVQPAISISDFGSTDTSIKEVSLLIGDKIIDWKERIPKFATITIRISFFLSEPKDLVAGFTLETPLGIPVYRLNTEGVGLSFPVKRGNYTLDFQLSDVNFGSDCLSLQVGITDKNGNILDSVTIENQLFFETTHESVGFLQFKNSAVIY